MIGGGSGGTAVSFSAAVRRFDCKVCFILRQNAIFDVSVRLRTLRPRCAPREGGGLLRPPLATEQSITRPNPASLALHLKSY